MFLLQTLTEHQSHLLGGFVAIVVLFCGLLGLLIYLDRRGVKTGFGQQAKRNDRPSNEKPPVGKKRNRRGKKK